MKHFKTAVVLSHTNRRTGRVRKWKDSYGFLAPDDPFDTRDVFLIPTAVADPIERDSIKFGVRVEYELDATSALPRAANVRVL